MDAEITGDCSHYMTIFWPVHQVLQIRRTHSSSTPRYLAWCIFVTANNHRTMLCWHGIRCGLVFFHSSVQPAICYMPVLHWNDWMHSHTINTTIASMSMWRWVLWVVSDTIHCAIPSSLPAEHMLPSYTHHKQHHAAISIQHDLMCV